jgi:hypothetical protein
MVEVQEKLEVAAAAMKQPEKMSVDELHVAKDSVDKAAELMSARLEKILCPGRSLQNFRSGPNPRTTATTSSSNRRKRRC